MTCLKTSNFFVPILLKISSLKVFTTFLEISLFCFPFSVRTIITFRASFLSFFRMISPFSSICAIVLERLVGSIPIDGPILVDGTPSFESICKRINPIVVVRSCLIPSKLYIRAMACHDCLMREQCVSFLDGMSCNMKNECNQIYYACIDLFLKFQKWFSRNNFEERNNFCL